MKTDFMNHVVTRCVNIVFVFYILLILFVYIHRYKRKALKDDR